MGRPARRPHRSRSHRCRAGAVGRAELGSPGGASKVGQTDNDPQAVKDLPPQGEDQLLGPSEIKQIRDIVRQVDQKYPPALSESGEKLPWDIEFGFVGGQLQLFQIRPLVRYSEVKTLGALAALEGESRPLETVQMDGPL